MTLRGATIVSAGGAADESFDFFSLDGRLGDRTLVLVHENQDRAEHEALCAHVAERSGLQHTETLSGACPWLEDADSAMVPTAAFDVLQRWLEEGTG